MGLFSSRMSDDQLARVREAAQNTNHRNKLAREANRTGKQSDRDALVAACGGSEKKAAKALEDSMRQHGARGKGLSRWIG